MYEQCLLTRQSIIILLAVDGGKPKICPKIMVDDIVDYGGSLASIIKIKNNIYTGSMLRNLQNIMNKRKTSDTNENQ